MEEEQKLILREVFGESSESEAEEKEGEEEQGEEGEKDRQQLAHFNAGNLSEIEDHIWEQIKEVKGLWLCRDFLSADQETWLLRDIEDEGWFTEGCHNQAHRFGDFPTWATELSSSIRQAAYFSKYVSECGELKSWDLNNEESCPLPSNLLWREPLFDQLIAHVYQPGNLCSCGSHAL